MAETPVATAPPFHPTDRIAAPTMLPPKPIVLREPTVLRPAIVRAQALLRRRIIRRRPPLIIPAVEVVAGHTRQAVMAEATTANSR